jgi:death-on-curing protein
VSEIIWISERAARAIHSQQLALFGGAEGILDPGKLSSSLARPRHLHTYNPDASLYPDRDKHWRSLLKFS